MTLYIDGTALGEIVYVLKGKNKAYKKIYRVASHENHKTLERLETFLKQAKVFKEKITKVVVNKGPGSYTGTRVSISHALALSLALGVPFQAL